MIRDDLFIRVIRKKASFDFKYNKDKDDFINNTKNNAIDTFILFHNNLLLFKYNRVQTVSNYPGAKLLDTVAPCSFQIKCFVEKRLYKEEIHGIINAVDMEGQPINEFSMQKDGGLYKGRWLIHGTRNPVTGKDYSYAYSMGCIVFRETKALDDFNELLKSLNIKSGDIINAELVEEA